MKDKIKLSPLYISVAEWKEKNNDKSIVTVNDAREYLAAKKGKKCD